MCANTTRKRVDQTPPVSAESHTVAQTLLKSGMLEPPSNPGDVGKVGRFEIVKPLREGGMGQVLLAREPLTEGLVAIKMIRPEYVGNKGVVSSFLSEAKHMYRMAHPNILKVLEVSDRAEGPYYVMPYVVGGSLASRMKAGEPLQEDRIVRIARQIADALSYAHSVGIIHRDLKPDNVLVDEDDRAYIMDFGLLRTVFNDASLDVQTRSVEGTLPYMSPGVAEGKAEDTRCDIYSFGAVLYEMLTGRPPYMGDDVQAVLRQIADGPPPSIRQIAPGAPAGLVKIAEGAMARGLRDRYAQMSDIISDLDRFARGQQPRGPHGRETGSKLRRKTVLSLAALAGLLLLAGLVAPFVWKKAPARKDAGLRSPKRAVPVLTTRFVGTQKEESCLVVPSETPYSIAGTYIVPAGCELKVAAGCTFAMDEGALLSVSGSLVINGETNKPVIFRRKNETASWAGIRFTETSTATLRNTRILGAKTGISVEGASPVLDQCLIARCGGGIVVGSSGMPALTNCLIAKCESDGVTLHASGIRMEHCTVEENKGFGISCVYYGEPILQDSIVTKNEQGGIRGSGYPHPATAHNSIVSGNKGPDVVRGGPSDWDFSSNWWGESNTAILVANGDTASLKCIEDGKGGKGGGLVLLNDFLKEEPMNCGATVKDDVYEGPVAAKPVAETPHAPEPGQLIKPAAVKVPEPAVAQPPAKSSQPAAKGTNVLEGRVEGERTLAGTNVVPQGGELRVAAGTVFLMDEGAQLLISGALVINGEPDKPVIFKRKNEKTSWKGIKFTEVSTGTLKDVHIFGADVGILVEAARPVFDRCLIARCDQGVVVGSRGMPVLTDCLITKCELWGVCLHIAGIRLERCTVEGNKGWGIWCSYYGEPVLLSSVVTNNGEGGIRGSGYDHTATAHGSVVAGNMGPDVVVLGPTDWDFSSNWWGEANTAVLAANGDTANLDCISDGRDEKGRGVVLLSDFLKAAPENCGSTLKDAQPPTEPVEYKGHCYQVLRDAMSWPDAKVACEERGGHLVIINDAEEDEVVKKLARQILAKGKCLWLGFSDGTRTGDWRWVDGTKVTFMGSAPDTYFGRFFYGCCFPDRDNWAAWDFGDNRPVDGYICEWDSASDMKNPPPEETGSEMNNAVVLSGNQNEPRRVLSAGRPYAVKGEYLIPRGSVLQIEAGTTLVFARNGGLTVNGSLRVNGTAKQPVMFEKATNARYWNGITIHEGEVGAGVDMRFAHIHGAIRALSLCDGTAAIEGCVISRNHEGGWIRKGIAVNCLIADNEGDGITMWGSQPTFRNCTIARNGRYGIFDDYSSAVRLENCIVAQNKVAGMRGNGTFEAHGCAIEGNGGTDLIHETHYGTTWNFASNWWGEVNTRLLQAGGVSTNLSARLKSISGPAVLAGFLQEMPKDCGAMVKDGCHE